MITWILGSFFFVFIACFVWYVWTRKVTYPQQAPQADEQVTSSPVDELPGGDTKRRIARDYRIEFSPRVFVDYPFGIRVVFAKAGATRQENPVQMVRSRHWSSGYWGWPTTPHEDSELVIQGGCLEFEADETEPTVRVKLAFAKGAFATSETTVERTLRTDADTVFPFWLNPLVAGACSLAVVLSQVVEGKGDRGMKKVSRELVTIPLDVSVAHFPIRLR